MQTYPGLPEPRVDVVVDYESSRQRYQGQAEFYIASLHLCGNTGTYVDAPRHRYRDATDLAGLALDRLADLPMVIVDATRAGRAIGEAALQNLQLGGRAVLVRTDFSERWARPATSATIRTSRPGRASCWSRRARPSSGSTRSTSMTRVIHHDRPTPDCC